jgi:N-sulfoglucosamine sulfohydrolase
MYRPFANLPSLLKRAGYRTARLGKLHVLPEDAFPFDSTWHDRRRISFPNRDVHATAEAAGRFVADAARTGAPFFLYLLRRFRGGYEL